MWQNYSGRLCMALFLQHLRGLLRKKSGSKFMLKSLRLFLLLLRKMGCLLHLQLWITMDPCCSSSSPIGSWNYFCRICVHCLLSYVNTLKMLHNQTNTMFTFGLSVLRLTFLSSAERLGICVLPAVSSLFSHYHFIIILQIFLNFF